MATIRTKCGHWSTLGAISLHICTVNQGFVAYEHEAYDYHDSDHTVFSPQFSRDHSYKEDQ